MKNLLKITFITILSLTIFSCNNNEEDLELDNSTLLENLKTEMIKFENNLEENKNHNRSSNSSLNSITQEDLESTLQSSITLIKSYGITDFEIIP